MSKVIGILCLTTVVALAYAIPSGNSSRGGIFDFLKCGPAGAVTINALNCDKISGNTVTAAVFGGSGTIGCNQKCTNGSTCYKVEILSNDKDLKSTQQTYYKCCTADGDNNHVNCGDETCSSSATGGSNANAQCCTTCNKAQATSIVPGV